MILFACFMLQAAQMFAIAATLKEKAYKLERDAWRLMTVATAGASIPNFWDLMAEVYDNPEELSTGQARDDDHDDDLAAVAAGLEVPPSSRASTPSLKMELDIEEIDLGDMPDEPNRPITIVYQQHAMDSYNDIGLPDDLKPKRMEYMHKIHFQCRFPGCTFSRTNRPQVCNHVRQIHLRVKIGCVHCEYTVLGGKAWSTHMRSAHPGLPTSLLQSTAVDPAVLSSQAAAIIAKVQGISPPGAKGGKLMLPPEGSVSPSKGKDGKGEVSLPVDDDDDDIEEIPSSQM